MSATQPRISREEIARRGEEAYARLTRSVLRPEDHGKFVAIDVESGEFEVDSNELAAVTRLHARMPGAQGWLVRAGFPTAHAVRGFR